MQGRPRRSLYEQLAPPSAGDASDQRRDRIEQHHVIAKIAPGRGRVAEILEDRLFVRGLRAEQGLVHVRGKAGGAAHLELLAREPVEVLGDEGRVERMLGRARLDEHPPASDARPARPATCSSSAKRRSSAR